MTKILNGVAPPRVPLTWAMLIKRVYEVDPLECPHCRGQMKKHGDDIKSTLIGAEIIDALFRKTRLPKS